jgi:hypothetical protein
VSARFVYIDIGSYRTLVLLLVCLSVSGLGVGSVQLATTFNATGISTVFLTSLGR